jgi:hypothetical protein
VLPQGLNRQLDRTPAEQVHNIGSLHSIHETSKRPSNTRASPPCDKLLSHQGHLRYLTPTNICTRHRTTLTRDVASLQPVLHSFLFLPQPKHTRGHQARVDINASRSSTETKNEDDFEAGRQVAINTTSQQATYRTPLQRAVYMRMYSM